MSQPVLLFDFDYTLFDTDLLKQAYPNYQDAKNYVATAQSLDAYVYAESENVLAKLKKHYHLVLLTEGEIGFQLDKVDRVSIRKYFAKDDVITVPPYSKAKILPQIIQDRQPLVLIDDRPDILDAATKLGLATIRIKRGSHADKPCEFLPSFEVFNLTEIVEKQLTELLKEPISRAQRVHCVGIKGVGMTPIALLLNDIGKTVSGSDTSISQITDSVLNQRDIDVTVFSPQVVNEDIDAVIYSGAYQRHLNPELKSAFKHDIPTITQAQALASIINQRSHSIAVCGVGGKTTTSGMLAAVFDYLDTGGWFSGVSQISVIKEDGLVTSLPPARADRSRYFVAEADEYAIAPPIDTRPKFALYQPKVIICTHLAYDHPDIYANFDTTLQTFANFFNRLPKDGHLIIQPKDLQLIKPYLDTKAQIVTYGIEAGVDWQIVATSEPLTYEVRWMKQTFSLKLGVIGAMNALNATAGLAATQALGLKTGPVLTGLGQFVGTKRRLETIAEVDRVLYLDDYGHHPDEIKLTLAAVKEAYSERRLVVVFHPHTLSRTKSLLAEFGQAFTQADQVIVAPIFTSAREIDDGSISAQDLTEAIKQSGKPVCYLPSFDAIVDFIKAKRQANDIILTMGAGDIYKIHETLIKQ